MTSVSQTAKASDATSRPGHQQPDLEPRPQRPERDDQQPGPDQVELLLDAERPEVAERRHVRLGEVVGRLEREPDVADRQGGGGAVLGDPGDLERRQEDRRQHDRDGHGRQRRRQDPAHPPRVEASEVDPAGLRVLAQQEPGDQEARHDEEDVDPGEPAAGHGQAHVEPQDGEDGDPPEALDVRQEAR